MGHPTKTEALETAEGELTLLERRAETLAHVEGREVRALKGSPPLHREWTVRSTWTTRCPP